ncbi:MAG TPA: hypothetical protein VLG47_07655 [Candidatus Saccharimonadales bacterium]|nr:hypothetical protein [Candidatus Saccharimonadales bacterium]
MADASVKLDNINAKLNKLEHIEEKVEKVLAKQEAQVKRIEKEESKIEKEEKHIEKSLVQVGEFTVKKSQVMEFSRGVAGAFVGVGLGQALGGSVLLAEKLPMRNAIGILIFILVMVGILIFKYDNKYIKGNAFWYIFKKIMFLYAIALVVEFLGLVLFNNFPGWNKTLVVALIIGSYPAMSAAAAFTLV